MNELSPLAEQVLAVVVPLFVAASVTVWLTVVVRAFGPGRVVPHQPRRPVPWDLRDLLLIGIAYVTMQLAAGLAVGPQALPRSIARLLIASTLANVLTLVCALVILIHRAGATAADLGLPGRRGPRDMKLGVLAFLALVVPVFALNALMAHLLETPYEHPVKNLLENQPTVANLLLCTLLAGVVAPVVEEVLFRLVLQGWLERVECRLLGDSIKAEAAVEDAAEEEGEFSPACGAADDVTELAELDDANPYAATMPERAELSGESEPPAEMRGELPGYPRGLVPVLCSSTLFALAHWGHGAAPIPLFALALGLGYLYLRTHRVLPCILVHLLLNGTSLAMMWLAALP